MAPGNGNYHFDNGEIDPEPYDPEMPRLRGGDASFHSYGVNGNHAQWNVPTPATGNGFGPLPGQGAGGGPEPDFYEVPAHDFYAARGGDRPRHVPASGTCAPAAEQFDFNDQQQPNPWQKAPKAVPQPQRPREPERQPEPEVEVQVRCFADCRNDRDLRGYIDSRNISVGFLTEIDLLIEGHPELKTFPGGLHTLRQLYTLPPLDALKYFLKGYTRPARYPDGIIRTDNFPLPPGYPYQPLSTKTDPELVEFFDGFEYRHDIIERIDQEVRGAMRELAHGGTIPVALRKLVCYAIWGNPVDAYKWFEYSYQREYMPHRYLPEHVVLGHIPKPAGYTEPRPLTDRSFKKHMDVRARMAQANDQGVDVLDVLMTEYRLALVRRGHRRLEADGLVAKAKQLLDNERLDPTGVDIVDFIMDDAITRQRTNHRNPPRRPRYRDYATFNLGAHRVAFHGVRQTFTRGNAGGAPGFLQVEAGDLRAAKASLLRLYNQEQHAFTKRGVNVRDSISQMLRSSRATAERRYVNCLIRYCRAANRMTPAQANELQKHFTRERMGDMALPNSDFLLGMFPRELY